MIGRLAVVGVALAAATAFPSFSAPLVDQAGVISDATEQQVDATLNSFQQRTSHQLAVAVIDTTGDASLEDYTFDLFKKWGVGDKDRDDGVLLLIAVDDRKLRIEVGSGVEGDLTDSESGRILREQLTPRLKAGDYDGAVVAGVDAIRVELGDTSAVAPVAPVTDPPGDGPSLPVTLIVGGLLLLSLVGGIGRRRRFGFGGPIIWGGGFGGGGSSGGW